MKIRIKTNNKNTIMSEQFQNTIENAIKKQFQDKAKTEHY